MIDPASAPLWPSSVEAMVQRAPEALKYVFGLRDPENENVTDPQHVFNFALGLKIYVDRVYYSSAQEANSPFLKFNGIFMRVTLGAVQCKGGENWQRFSGRDLIDTVYGAGTDALQLLFPKSLLINRLVFVADKTPLPVLHCVFEDPVSKTTGKLFGTDIQIEPSQNK